MVAGQSKIGRDIHSCVDAKTAIDYLVKRCYAQERVCEMELWQEIEGKRGVVQYFDAQIDDTAEKMVVVIDHFNENITKYRLTLTIVPIDVGSTVSKVTLQQARDAAKLMKLPQNS